MDVYNILKEILEVASLIVGIGIGLTVFIAYKNFKMMKKESEKNHHRLSIEKSIEYISKFAEETLPLLKEYEAYLESKDEALQQLFRSKAFEGKYRELTYEDLKEMGKYEVFKIVNFVDVLATVINSGIADKDTAFRSLGKNFCECVEVTADVIEYFRRTEHPALFHETEILYHEWREKFDDIIVKVTV